MLVHHLLHAPLERDLSCQQFIGHHGKSVLVGCRNGMAFPLLGGHISWRTTNSATCANGCSCEFGDAKIGKQQIGMLWILAIPANEEVRWLDILVGNPMVMSMLERLG